jgi:hypothetical protein
MMRVEIPLRGARGAEMLRLLAQRAADTQGTLIEALPVSEVPAGSTLLKEECQVCFDSFEVGVSFKTLPCLHKYHVHCIDTWLVKKPTCPVCLNPVSSANA